MTNSKKKCPHCGSRNTANILWGMPAWSDELKRKLDAKEIVLGGCCLEDPLYRYHCFDCEKSFNDETSNSPVVELYFQIGGFCGGYEHIYLNTQTHGKLLKYARTMGGQDVFRMEYEHPDLEIQQVALEDCWDAFSNDLRDCRVGQWKRHYEDSDILDGTQWNLELLLENGKQIKRDGSNAYPPRWGNWIDLLCKYGLQSFRNQ